MEQNGASEWPALAPQGHHMGKPPIPLRRAVTLIGGRHTAHIHLLSRQVSKAHAIIINDAGRLFLCDLASRTHSFVNGREVGGAELENGDLLQIGSFKFKVSNPVRRTPRRDRNAPTAAIESADSELPIPLDGRVALIGRRASCDIPLLEETVSTAHAVIFELAGKRFIRDLGSRTGTFIKGRPIHQEQLSFGDEIRIGETIMRYVAATAAPALAAAEDFDELEHLVGTAPLTPDAIEEAVSALDKANAAEELAEASEVEKPEASEGLKASEPTDEAVIAGVAGELAALEGEESAEGGAATETTEETATESPQSADESLVEPRLEEIDLDDDAEGASAHDTRSIAPAPERPRVRPELSEQVVDEIDISDDGEARSLVAGDLASERLSSSVTHEGMDPAGETVLDEEVASGPLPVPGGEEAEVAGPLSAAEEGGIEVGQVEESKLKGAPAEVGEVGEMQLPEEVGDEAPAEGRVVGDLEPPLGDGVAGTEVGEVEELEFPGVEAAPKGEVGEIEPLELKAPEETPATDVVAQVEDAEAGERPLIADEGLEEATTEDRAPGTEMPPTVESPTETEVVEAKPKKRGRKGKGEPKAPAKRGRKVKSDDEVLPPTQPTPDSAQGLEEAVAEGVDASVAAGIAADGAVLDLTDTGFDAEVMALGSDSPDPVLEMPAAVDDGSGQGKAAADEEVVEATGHGGEDGASREGTTREDAEAPAVESDERAAGAAESVEVHAPAVDALDEGVDGALEAEPVAGGSGAPVLEVEAVETPALELLELEEVEAPPAESVEMEAPSLESAEGAAAIDFSAEPEAPRGIDLPDLDFSEALDRIGSGDETAESAESVAPGTLEEAGRGPGDAGPEAGFDAPLGYLGGMPLDLSETEPAKEAGEPYADADGVADDVGGDESLEEQPPASADDVAGDAAREQAPGGAFEEPLDEPRVEPLDEPRDVPRGAPGGMVLPPRPNLSRPGREVDRHVEENVFASGRDGEGAPNAFEGLAMAGGEDIDVFSQMPMPADDDPLLTGVARATTTGGAGAPGGARPASAAGGRAATPEEIRRRGGAKRPAGGGPIIPPTPRKKPTVPTLLLMMLLSALAAGAAIWWTQAPQARFQGAMVFQNAAAPVVRAQLQRTIEQALGQAELRESAKAIFRTRGGSEPGFLGDTVAFGRLASTGDFAAVGPRDEQATWLLVRESRDGADKARMDALMAALFADSRLANLAGAYHSAVQKEQAVKDAVAGSQAVVDQRTREIGELDAILQGRKTESQLKPLEEQVAALEAAWRKATGEEVGLQEELDRMRRAPAATGPAGNGATAGPEDVDLRNMKATLADLRGRLDVVRNAGRERSDAARKTLDAAIDELRGQIAAVQGQMNANPELKAYVVAVRQLQLSVQELTAELLQNQKEQVDRIAALKTMLDEKRIARQNRIWESDKELSDLNEQLELTTRRHNAALGGGDETAGEAARLAGEIDGLTGQIARRRELLGGDKDYEEAIARLQEVIDANQKRLAESRARVDGTLEKMQAALAGAQPAVDKLPEEQKALAEGLEKKLAAMNEARRAYAEAMGAPATADAASGELVTAIAEMEKRIDERGKQFVAEQNRRLGEQQELDRLRAMEGKRAELAAAREAKASASAAYFKAHRQLEDARTAIQRRAEAVAQFDQAKRELAVRREALEAMLRQPAVAYPQPPRVIETDAETDMRPTYTLASSAMIFVVFAGLIVWAGRPRAGVAGHTEPETGGEQGDAENEGAVTGNGAPGDGDGRRIAV